MENRRTILSVVLVVVLAVAGIVGLTWANYRFATQNPGGNDFIPRWEGTRLLLTQGWSPYSPDTTREIQKLFYGRKARAGEDHQLFVYPLYSFVVFAPFALVQDYPLARALWMTVLEISLITLTLVSISLSNWNISKGMLVVLLLFTALWYHGVRSVINGNAAILSALLIAFALLAIRAEHDVLGGFILALATIKPQIVVLFCVFVIVWAISQQRWTLVWGFLGSLGLMVAATSLLFPTWLIDNLKQILAYPTYTQPGTPGAIFAIYMPGIGRQLGWVVTVFMVGILIWEWRAAWGQDFRWFLWTAYLTLVITNLIGIRTATDNFLALFPALVLVLAVWDERWGRLGPWLVFGSVIFLFFGLWWLFLATMDIADQPLQSPILFFPFPIFLLIGLYWVRMWAVRPQKLLLQKLHSNESL